MQGHVDGSFEGVREVLEQSIEAGENLGATVSVMIEGDTVVDLAGGFQDKAKTLPFTTDTLACVFSSGKAVCAALVMVAVSEGKLSYDQTVASLWPEFGQAGKQDITVAQVLSHQAGLAAFVEEQDPKIWLDWDATCAAIAAMEPLWEPGTASGYGPQTYGYIAGEILRRVNEGQSVGQQLRKLTRDVICGMTLSEATRAAPLVKPKQAPDLGELNEIKKAAFLKPWSAPSGVSRQEWAAAEIPASNMHANARGLAEFMQLFAFGTGLGLTASDEAREEAWKERIHGPDKVLPFTLSWAAGVMRETGEIFGAPPTAIGHYGFGGSCVMADPARGLSFAFVPNKQSPHLVADPRAVALIRAVYQAVS
ncbi:serine hydrolase domain-containing protein [Parvularcula lutaonensis]|uniref:Serine hydrolase domain-containing protein n=1 Tax=Parvularcula lutaonensis TaxID=491923 RepID=A0ABV7MDY4_9PROT|nr:serine hydrolase domain-containing protein [Parvularcula lutaonensis]GGY54224.1 esterase [Parvularcula lutaonensis]